MGRSEEGAKRAGTKGGGGSLAFNWFARLVLVCCASASTPALRSSVAPSASSTRPRIPPRSSFRSVVTAATVEASRKSILSQTKQKKSRIAIIGNAQAGASSFVNLLLTAISGKGQSAWDWLAGEASARRASGHRSS